MKTPKYLQALANLGRSLFGTPRATLQAQALSLPQAGASGAAGKGEQDAWTKTEALDKWVGDVQPAFSAWSTNMAGERSCMMQFSWPWTLTNVEVRFTCRNHFVNYLDLADSEVLMQVSLFGMDRHEERQEVDRWSMTFQALGEWQVVTPNLYALAMARA